jgi:hypothetical protein
MNGLDNNTIIKTLVYSYDDDRVKLWDAAVLLTEPSLYIEISYIPFQVWKL